MKTVGGYCRAMKHVRVYVVLTIKDNSAKFVSITFFIIMLNFKLYGVTRKYIRVCKTNKLDHSPKRGQFPQTGSIPQTGPIPNTGSMPQTGPKPTNRAKSHKLGQAYVVSACIKRKKICVDIRNTIACNVSVICLTGK